MRRATGGVVLARTRRVPASAPPSCGRTPWRRTDRSTGCSPRSDRRRGRTAPIGGPERGVVLDGDRVLVDPADEAVRDETRTSGEVDPVGHRPMTSIRSCASCSAPSSWRKWWACAIVTCGCPAAPGTRCWNTRSPPTVTGSLSLKHGLHRSVSCYFDSMEVVAEFDDAGEVFRDEGSPVVTSR